MWLYSCHDNLHAPLGQRSCSRQWKQEPCWIHVSLPPVLPLPLPFLLFFLLLSSLTKCTPPTSPIPLFLPPFYLHCLSVVTWSTLLLLPYIATCWRLEQCDCDYRQALSISSAGEGVWGGEGGVCGGFAQVWSIVLVEEIPHYTVQQLAR